MKTPVTLSAEQLDALRAVHDDNARPVQDLEGRSVQQVAIQ
jgi:carbonic anhydrase